MARHDLTAIQFEQANRLLDAFDPAHLVEDVVYDVCQDVAAQLPPAAMDRLVQAAELAKTRRQNLARLEAERFTTSTTSLSGVTRG